MSSSGSGERQVNEGYQRAVFFFTFLPPKFVTLLNASLTAYLYVKVHWEVVSHNEDYDQVEILGVPRIQSVDRQIDPTEGHGRI